MITDLQKKHKLELTQRHLMKLLEVAKYLQVHGAPLDMKLSLAEIASEFMDASRETRGRRPRKLWYLATLAVFAAAVTVLKKERGVEGAIADVATPYGIGRKELKNFRQRLNRGRADTLLAGAYRLSVAKFETMSKADIFVFLSKIFVSKSH
jgi:hypothetical protein